ncbi:hypothetical protein EDD15DRAFT_2199204 [Pisolithus albus]|nr:hypothetical protein EDD15DRAFT_2199204 [Pisolithus albus]
MARGHHTKQPTPESPEPAPPAPGHPVVVPEPGPADHVLSAHQPSQPAVEARPPRNCHPPAHYQSPQWVDSNMQESEYFNINDITDNGEDDDEEPLVPRACAAPSQHTADMQPARGDVQMFSLFLIVVHAILHLYHSILPMYHIPIVIPLHHAPNIIHTNVTGIINSVRAIMICPHHREGTITVSSDMSIEIFHVSDTMAMIQMMTIIAVTIMSATKRLLSYCKDWYTPLIPQWNAS